jgi:pyrimidine deaminase RibD-like protein
MNRYLAEAVKLAMTSRCRHRHGCVVVYDGIIIGAATNKVVSDQTKGWRKSHVHAEAAALMQAGTRANGAHVYVARVLKDGSPADSRPCRKCEGFLERYGVKSVRWTA